MTFGLINDLHHHLYGYPKSRLQHQSPSSRRMAPLFDSDQVASLATHLFSSVREALEDLTEMKRILERVELYMLALTALIYLLTILGAFGILCKFCYEKHQKAHVIDEFKRQTQLGNYGKNSVVLNSMPGHLRKTSSVGATQSRTRLLDDRYGFPPQTNFSASAGAYSMYPDNESTMRTQKTDIPRIAIQQPSFDVEDALRELDGDSTVRIRGSSSEPELVHFEQARHNQKKTFSQAGDELV